MDLFDSSKRKYLCVIGNGFDLHHDLETAYSDFYEYLMKHGKSDFAIQLESYFQAERIDKDGNRRLLLWSDLEGAIGDYDIDHIYHESSDWVDIDLDHYMRTAAQKEDSPDTFLAPLLEALPTMMEEWIASVGLEGVEADVDLPMTSKFLTFNYTRTLETVYHIHEDFVLHIHGVVGGASELVVGHRGKCDESDAFDENAPVYEEDSKLNIIRIMKAHRKPTEEIIAMNADFFNSLQDVCDVYVYGHSYSMVDKDYFEEIRNKVGEETRWHLGCHDEDGKNAAEAMMNAIGVPAGNWERFKF